MLTAKAESHDSQSLFPFESNPRGWTVKGVDLGLHYSILTVSRNFFISPSCVNLIVLLGSSKLMFIPRKS